MIFPTNYPERREPARRLRRILTDPERRLWSRLRGRNLEGLKFRRQFPVGPFFADFCCLEKRLIVEVDGSQHADTLEEDQARTLYMKEQGFNVIRFWNNEVLKSIDAVCEQILVDSRMLPHPNPLPEGEGGKCPGEAKKW